MNKQILDWRQSMVRIGFTVTAIMMLPVPLILGNPGIWIIVGGLPLILPLLFGNNRIRF